MNTSSRFAVAVFLLSYSLPAAASVTVSDTLINGIRCERTIEYFGNRVFHIGDTMHLFVKKILPDGSLADFLPSQRFHLVVRSPHQACRFIFPGGKTSLDTFNVSLPVAVLAAEAGTIQAYAFALMNGDTSYLPLTVGPKSAEPNLLQLAAQSKMKHKHYEQARMDLMRAAGLDSANRHLYYYDVACAYSLEGRTAEALHWLRVSIDAGFNNYVHALKNDPDLDPLRGLLGFRETVVGSLMREREKLMRELNAKPERAAKNFVTIAGSFLTQGDIDSFYVSLEAALRRGHVPGPQDFQETKRFGLVENESRLHQLYEKYVSSVFLKKDSRMAKQAQKSAEQTGRRPSPPVVNSRWSLMPEPTTTSVAMIILQTGDSVHGKSFYSVDWSDKSIREIGHLAPDEAGKATRISASWKGVIAFDSDAEGGMKKLIVRTPAQTITLNPPFQKAYISGGHPVEDRSFPEFTLSTDGTELVASARRDLGVVDTGDGTLFTQYLVARLHVGEKAFESPRLDTIVTQGYDADAGFDRLLLGWDKNGSQSVLFQDVYPQQLRTLWLHLWSYEPVTRTYTLLSRQIERYLGSSSDGRYVLFTSNDETCCSGINYTDNRLILHDTKSRIQTVVFDEWSRFESRGKPEEHQPKSAALSPNGKLIAATIRNLYDPSAMTSDEESVEKFRWGRASADHQLFLFTRDGSVTQVFSDRDFIGWLDDTHVLLTQRTEEFRREEWVVTKSEPRVLDIETGAEEPLLVTGGECLAIQWRTRK